MFLFHITQSQSPSDEVLQSVAGEVQTSSSSWAVFFFCEIAGHGLSVSQSIIESVGNTFH